MLRVIVSSRYFSSLKGTAVRFVPVHSPSAGLQSETPGVPSFESRILRLASPSAILQQYIEHRTTTRAQSTDWRAKRSSAAAALILTALALSRVSATLQGTSAEDLSSKFSERLAVLVDDFRRLVCEALAAPAHLPVHLAASEPRFVATTLHCIARLYEQRGVRQDAAFDALLRQALSVSGIVNAPSPQPHGLAQVAWAVAIYPTDVVLKTATDVQRAFRPPVPSRHELTPLALPQSPHVWLWNRISAALSRLEAVSPRAAKPASSASSVRPVDLAMLATAFVHAGSAARDGFSSLAKLALRGSNPLSARGAEAKEEDERVPHAPLRHFSSSALAALPTAIAAAHSSWSRQRALPHYADPLEAPPPTTLGGIVHASVTAAVTDKSTSSADALRPSAAVSPVTHSAVLELLVEVSREVAIRLAAAEETWQSSLAEAPSRTLRREVYRRSSGESERSASSRIDEEIDRAEGMEEPVDVIGSARNERIPPPLPLRTLAALLRAYTTLGFRSPELFSSAAHFLGLVSASSGSDSGGSSGFRALGTHPGDKAVGSASGTPLPLEAEPPDGDVAVISTTSFKVQASLAVAFSKARYADEADTPRMWAALLASATTTLALASERVVTGSSVSQQQRQRSGNIEPSDVAGLLHACSDASIPAARLALAALSHLSAFMGSYSLPLAARVLWAASLQDTYSAHVSAEVFKRAAAAGTGSRGGDGSSKGNPGAGPDGSDLGPGARLPEVVQSQLYMAWLGLALEGAGPRPEIDRALGAVPPPLLGAWRSAYAHSERDFHASSRLHGDVSRLLSLAAVHHESEVLLPEGFRVDVVVPAASTTLRLNPTRRTPLPAQGHGQQQPHQDVVVLEVNGPSHYAPRVQGAGTLAFSQTSPGRRSPLTYRPEDTKLPHVSLSSLDAFGDDQSDAGGGDALVSRGPPLVPSLRTRTRSRWLAAAGYPRITIDWAEWASRPSTEERLELLADKGILVPRHLLSY
jgi:hypothetical protein